MINKALKLGKYRHYSGKEYELVGLAKFGENSERELEDMVVYKPLYENKEFPGMLWVRTVKEFTEEIEKDGKKMKRFEYIGE